jgi:uncharacterized protein (TIGR04255 family)
MTERAHYRNAPITEALIDLRTTHAQDVSVNDLGVIGEKIADDYPTQEAMYLYSGQMAIGEPGHPMRAETAHQHGGFRFTSQNKQQIFQARIDGFTFSTLAPYDRWESFRDEARRLWELYRSAARVEGVTRAAVRYINRIDIPKVGTVRLEDYLRTYPEVSEDMPQEGQFGNFFMQVQFWQEDLGCVLIINLAPAASPNEETTTSIRLDLDLFREQFAEPWRADDEAAWEFLEELHDRKNEVFEASITEETRRLIR